MNLYVARAGRDGSGAQRELARSFSVTRGAGRSETREYLDTFDWRLFRAGFTLARVAGRIVFADLVTGELVAQGAWRRATLPRFARDLPADDLRRFVTPVTDPRALLPIARIRIAVRDVELRNAAGRVVAGIRSESATVRHRGQVRRIAALAVDASHASTRAAVTDALARAGLRPSGSSWFETMVRAAGCRPGDGAARPRIQLAPGTPSRAAVAAIFLHLRDVMRRNERGVRDDIDVEFLHDFRVALRRTRTGLTELKEVLPAGDESAFRERFRALAGPTGAVRDFDVHIGRREEYTGRLPREFRSGLDAVFASMERSRETARAELLAMLSSREYTSLMRDWKRALDSLARGETGGVLADEPAVVIARRAIRRRHARLRAIASAPEALDDAALHRARLNAKKLRYLIEFFREGMGRKTAATLTAVEKAQDALGEYNDLGIQLREFREALRALPDAGGDSYRRTAALGGIISLLEARRGKVRRRCQRRLRALRAPLPRGI
ncbi:MAG TPA: CHAD domain-containing protein, partial [Candidatus Krumholzibacteria bacterium]|nr:CHAD domain-containing protein [Candidatus Krumholzibacteria bacterium]